MAASTADADFTTLYNRIVTDNPGHVVSTSWGVCEVGVSAATQRTDDNIFTNANAIGQSWFAASGDSGSRDCSNLLGVDNPANSPHVMGVGGTTPACSGGMTSSSPACAGYGSESAWSGSGGGVSLVFARPAFQRGCGVPAGTQRLVPDVALEANPSPGNYVAENGSWWVVGGTSDAAPQWAGLAAELVQQSGGALGNPGALLYGRCGTAALHDITSGSNIDYSAGVGYDMVTGLGSFDARNLLAAVAPTSTTTTSTTTTTLPGRCTSPPVIPAQGGTFSGTTSGTSSLAGSCGSSGTSPEQVFQWTPAVSGTATIQTCGAGTTFDTVLYLRSGTCAGGPETAAGCNDDACTNATGLNRASRLTPTVTAGQTYFIVVDGYGGAQGIFSLAITPPASTTTTTADPPATSTSTSTTTTRPPTTTTPTTTRPPTTTTTTASSSTTTTTIPSGTADEIHWTVTGQTSVSFDWRGSATVIRYGLTSAYGQSATGQRPSIVPFSSAGPFWEAHITGLQENTVYHYSVAASSHHTFRTPPPRGSAGFTVYAEGDIGSSRSYPAVAPIQALIAAGRPNFVLALGDLTYANANGEADVDQHFNDVMVWSQDAAYEVVWGNHEWDGPTDNLKNYKGRFDFANPQTDPASPSVSCCGEDWHWFDYGNTRFIAYPEPWDNYGHWFSLMSNTSGTGIMDQAQADPNIRFIVTFGHRPALSTGAP